MGADLVSYMAVMPARAAGKIIKTQLKQIQDALKTKSPEQGWRYIVESLGVSGWEYENYSEDRDAVRLIEMIREDVALLKGYTGGFLDTRDSGGGHITVNGKKVLVIYAGDMSWGDEPDGVGYLMLRALSRLGITEVLESAVNQSRG